MKKKRTAAAEKKTPSSQRKTPTPAAPDTEDPQPENTPGNPEIFPIIGIGASAGGLAAFEAFFSGMPAGGDPGMAFILVQHLDPNHHSILGELISRYTRMQVIEAGDGMRIQPDCVYIKPPGGKIALLNGTLQLLPKQESRGPRLSIDSFFRSLAQELGDQAVCVVLSGSGCDGTLGIRSIKAEGGMVVVQQPDSAEFDGMPRSAISTGLVDYVLPPEEMPQQIITYLGQVFGPAQALANSSTVEIETTLNKIFLLLRLKTGHDFSLYKPSTIMRRIERRMALLNIDSPSAYRLCLQASQEEVEALFRDLLIGVTSFFRDPAAFETLRKDVVPRIFENRQAGDPVRIWCPACSTGEEVYSLAILFQEYLDERKLDHRLQIFGTDIDTRAIDIARAGIYPASISAEVSEERLERFFEQDLDGTVYRIKKRIRDILIFSEHSVVKDPPFSRLDLLSCRNLLIYMNGELQKKLIPIFHYALKQSGILFLGTSETVGECDDLFSILNQKSKVYQRKDADRRATMQRILPPLSVFNSRARLSLHDLPVKGQPSFKAIAERAIIEQTAPAGALINGQGDILYLHGRTGIFLEPAPGEAGVNNIIQMAREGLRPELIKALHQATETGESVRRSGLRVKTNGNYSLVDLTIAPVAVDQERGSAGPLFIALLIEVDNNVDTSDSPEIPADDDLTALKQELKAKEEYLQTANEELRSANEEMQSVNEELQSTNEELETSKEELQSVNEELSIVNTELQGNVSDLSRANNDMNNLLSGTGIGTVFVDNNLCILRFTPTVTSIINLILTDIGRPVGHIVSNLDGYDTLVEDVEKVLSSLVPMEQIVSTKDGTPYKMRIQPYRTVENMIEGVVITFVDITDLNNTQQSLRSALKDNQDLLNELEHRAKNNLMMISSMISLAGKGVKTPDVETVLQDLNARVRSISELYNLLQHSDSFTRVDLGDYCLRVAGSLLQLSSNLQLQSEIESVLVPVNIGTSIGMVVTELVINSVKYAFPDGQPGVISLGVKKSPAGVVLEVADNGIGLPEGVDAATGTGLGLSLVGSLVKQIKGTLSIESDSSGVRCRVDFPLQEDEKKQVEPGQRSE